jgi:hypothetical protein
MGTELVPAPWSPVRRVFFRFACVYLVLYILPFPIDAILLLAENDRPVVPGYTAFWDAAVPWVGQHVFGAEITVQPNGSGDTTYNYVQVFCYAVLAIALTAVWSIIDRKRQRYDRLDTWLRAYVRFYLAAMMISYGAVKVIKAQFPTPGLGRMVEPIGDQSPMGLLWNFMGMSQSYNVFTGIGEILGGLLLTTRRTTLLGALVSAGMLAHVVMLNFSYDVPVKLLSLHLLLAALFLAAPELRRLVDFFVLNRPTEPAVHRPLIPWKWPRRAALVLRTLLVLGFTGASLYQAQALSTTIGDHGPQSPLSGVWNVEEYAVDGAVRPPLITEGTRWRRVAFDGKGVTVQLMNDTRQMFLGDLDLDAHTLTLQTGPTAESKSTLTASRPESDRLVLEGVLSGRPIRANLQRDDSRRFLLLDRGFHWINEFPFHR